MKSTFDTEPIEVDPVGCRNIADLIKKAQREFTPELDDFSLNKLTLRRYTGDQDSKKESCLSNQDLKTILDALLPVIKKPKTSHHSEERKKRWEELNFILIQAAIDAAAKSGKKNLKGSSAYSSLNWSLISPVYNHIIHDYSQTVKKVPQKTMKLMHNYIVTLTRCLGSVTNGKEQEV